MAWAYTKDGREMARPSAEGGIYVDGPLAAKDLKLLIEALVEELEDQAKKELLEALKPQGNA